MPDDRAGGCELVHPSSRTHSPAVTVAVPVWNVRDYLRECLDSVLGQSIGLESIEIIAVDDGSTDGSGAILDEYAGRSPQVRVVHQAASGGPGAPRNRALELARGRYVFFLDADDYLGPEALERLVACADRNGSDIVLGKIVGLDGRVVPTRAFRRSLERASLEDVYSTGSVLKLFRRSLLDRLELRFDESVPGGEDGAFTAQAYLEARAISVVADYDCYYARSRPHSQTHRQRRNDETILAYIDHIERQRMELVARYRRPGLARDRLMVKHVIEALKPFVHWWVELDPNDRDAAFDAGARVIRRWCTPAILLALPPWLAIRAHCLAHGLATPLADIVRCPTATALRHAHVEGRRIYAAYPHFRDGTGIPDRLFEITSRVRHTVQLDHLELAGGRLELGGHAYLTLLGGETRLVLRRHETGPEHEIPVRAVPTALLADHQARYRRAGIEASVDLATLAGGPLEPGTWRLLAITEAGSVRRTTAVRKGHLASCAPSSSDVLGAEPRLCLTPAGEVCVRVGRVGLLADIGARVAALPGRARRRAVRSVQRHRTGRLAMEAIDVLRRSSPVTQDVE